MNGRRLDTNFVTEPRKKRDYWDLGNDPILNLVELLEEQSEQPKRFERLAFRGLAEGAISESEAAELLGVSVRELNRRSETPS